MNRFLLFLFIIFLGSAEILQGCDNTPYSIVPDPELSNGQHKRHHVYGYYHNFKTATAGKEDRAQAIDKKRRKKPQSFPCTSCGTSVENLLLHLQQCSARNILVSSPAPQAPVSTTNNKMSVSFLTE